MSVRGKVTSVDKSSEKSEDLKPSTTNNATNASRSGKRKLTPEEKKPEKRKVYVVDSDSG